MSEENMQVDPLAEFTPEQKEILQNVYMFTDEYEITEEEMATAREMFDTAKKFQILRKILGVYTQPERGMTMSNIQSLVEAQPSERTAYVIETAVQNLADVKLQSALIKFYNKIRGQIGAEKVEFFRAENKKKFEEEQRAEEAEAQEAEDERKLPENV